MHLGGIAQRLDSSYCCCNVHARHHGRHYDTSVGIGNCKFSELRVTGLYECDDSEENCKRECERWGMIEREMMMMMMMGRGQ